MVTIHHLLTTCHPQVAPFCSLVCSQKIMVFLVVFSIPGQDSCLTHVPDLLNLPGDEP